MKTLVLIALIMILVFSGCASTGIGNSIKQEWDEYLMNPGYESDKWIKADWKAFWKDPLGYLGLVKHEDSNSPPW